MSSIWDVRRGGLMGLNYSTDCCQVCGNPIGWVGRVFQYLFGCRFMYGCRVRQWETRWRS